MQQLNVPMSSWRPAPGTSLEPDAQGGLAFSIGTAAGPQVLRLSDRRLVGAMVRLTIKARPLPGCSTQLLVLHPRLGVAVCRVSPAGIVADRGIASAVEAHRDDTGALTIGVTYFSTIADAAVGTTAAAPSNVAGQRPQYAFDEISVSAAPATPPEAAVRIVLVEVGAESQSAPLWRRLMPNLAPVLVPRPTAEKGALDEAAAAYPAGQALQAVLYNKKARRKLNRAAAPGRSSLLAVDRRTLRKFADPAPFEVLDQVSTECVRFDELHAAGATPAPDAVLLDAQGTEYEALQGFGALLGTCLAIQVRAALYPVYKGQKLLTDISALLDKSDFTMVALVPLHQDGQVIEADAWFIKTAEWAAGQSPAVRARLDAIREIPGFGGRA